MMKLQLCVRVMPYLKKNDVTTAESGKKMTGAPFNMFGRFMEAQGSAVNAAITQLAASTLSGNAKRGKLTAESDITEAMRNYLKQNQTGYTLKNPNRSSRTKSRKRANRVPFIDTGLLVNNFRARLVD